MIENVFYERVVFFFLLRALHTKVTKHSTYAWSPKIKLVTSETERPLVKHVACVPYFGLGTQLDFSGFFTCDFATTFAETIVSSLVNRQKVVRQAVALTVALKLVDPKTE